jgi:DNA-binding NtrC family response regulator
LLSYPWPGNVRELENAIERAVVLGGADILTPEAFVLDPLVEEDNGVRSPAFPIAQVPQMSESLQDCLDRAASSRIKLALDEANGNRAEAAAALGVDRTTLYRLIKRLGL